MNESKTRRRKSGKIPEFGNWDYSNELPITQYFESARQPGLIHYTASSCSSSGECDLYMVSSDHPHHDHGHFLNNNPSHPIKDFNLARRRRKECDLTTTRVREPLHKTTIVRNEVQHKNYYDNAHVTVISSVVPKPVDEDLYKISPDRLRSSKQKRSAGFFQRCLRPPCMV